MIDPREILAIIPARGGSKGVPGKNLQPVGGRPLVVRSIEQARAARHVGRVVVSTDDPEIAAVAVEAGAEVIARPLELSGDEASSESALLHALDELERAEGRLPEILVFLQCTSPLTQARDIDGIVETVRDGGADCALAATPSHAFLWRRGADGSAEPVNHDAAHRPRRQDREPEWAETGAAYALRVEGFRRAGHRFFGRTALYEIPRQRSLEIDDSFDLHLARHLAHALDPTVLPRPVAGVVLDFDGVLTDNRVLVSGDGSEAVWCSREDGMGIDLLRAAGVPMVVLSSERHPVVAARCRKLGLECVQGLETKSDVLREWAAKQEIDLAHVVYVGNDANDLDCLRAVGCPAVPADAHPTARAAARLHLTRPGGRGAVRQLVDLILESKAR